MTQYAMKQNDGKKLVHQSQSGVTDSSADLTPEEKAYKDAVTRALLVRACHLPNNTWMQDWKQYMVNNHPILGICFHHKYHPVRGLVRAFSLVGSILFGLAVTNIIYLAFVFTATDYGKSYVTVQSNVTVTGQPCVDSNVVPALSVTNGNIALWTVGAFLNACFDNLIWALAACTCFMEGRGMTEQKLARYRSTGVFFVMVTVVVVTALATFAAALRKAVSYSNDTSTPQLVSSADSVQVFQVNGVNNYEFMLSYIVAMALNFFVYYPIIGTIIFSGILTCGRFPVVGGRPFELKEEAVMALEEANDVEQTVSQKFKKSTIT